MPLSTTPTGLHTSHVGTPAYDAAQDPLAQAAALAEVVEGMPSRINPSHAAAENAVQAFWDAVGAAAVANGFDPNGNG